MFEFHGWPKGGGRNKALLTISEFHSELGGAIGINTIRRAVREGRIHSLQVGERKRVIPSSEVHAWPRREAGLEA